MTTNYRDLRKAAWLSLMVITMAFLLAATDAVADQIRPFQSDGCSMFPDGTRAQQDLWLRCCEEHDYTYWKGGTYEQRQRADERLKACVADVGEPGIAELMLAGVRVGGTPYLPTRFRWSYGWPYFRGYKALTRSELKQIEALENSN